ncbi:NUDIX domain-containing protein [Roseitranquillus sediminis]|uniref:NUDIX domain-containing protein n=1 Tax=Roseitranquillus sediminis TaxID=2809051 RepID=UPI001D0CA75E|nr:NUDIX domain-containing protein [Roseitranquillus sediminis]MBM9595698.1 NUDIX domain-containing protein [Roseitranquillus sediminis]
MERAFFYGTLRDDDLRRIVLGAEVAVEPATLDGFAVRATADVPTLVAKEGASADGLMTASLGEETLRRLEFYEASFGHGREPALLGGIPVIIWRADVEASAVDPWRLDHWQEKWGSILREAARETMEYISSRSPDWVAGHRPMILQRADSAARAKAVQAPAEVRRGFDGADVEVRAHRRPYADYFTLVEQDLRFRRFDGSWSETVTRSGLIASDAVTVLPYDPRRDEVMLLEQYRYGPWLRGDERAWTLEPVAGRIDPGETPEATALRETREEAALEIARLERVGGYYASTGCLSEYVHSYVGICDLAARGGEVGGAMAEQEDILSHVLPFARLMELVASGEAEDAPLLVTAWWLQAHRARLRDAAAA